MRRSDGGVGARRQRVGGRVGHQVGPAVFVVGARVPPGSQQGMRWCHMVLAVVWRILTLDRLQRITVGVVFNTGGQTEEDAFRNTAGSARFTRLMRVLAARVPLAGWRHFDGGVSATQAQEIYYTSWRGFEVVFHVAHELGGEARRQHLGNDKCLIHYCEAGGGPVRPEFRGHVNSVALVVTCLDESECERRAALWSIRVSRVAALAYGNQHMAQWGCPAELWGPGQAEQPVAWRVAAFSRRRVTNFRPCVTTSLIRDPDVVRCALRVAGCLFSSRGPASRHRVGQCGERHGVRVAQPALLAQRGHAVRRGDGAHCGALFACCSNEAPTGQVKELH